MVIGIDVFRDFFKNYFDSYLIIGGTACDIIVEEAGFTPRTTDDIDIILIIEALKPEFVRRFFEFIKSGNYAVRQIEEGKRNCYRFRNPANKSFPKQVELFSRVPDIIELSTDTHITPVHVEDGLSTLSAILLNDDYYNFAIGHSEKKDDIHIANVEAVICLKAFAYLDNLRRKAEGQEVRNEDIMKHKYDVFRMVFMMKPDVVFDLPHIINSDLQRFADTVKHDLPNPDIFKRNGFDVKDMNAIYQRLLTNFKLTA
ncbi:MAG: hypothetical protein HY738_24590 [Bacteroidia bacterium]|nr:hypothetical protein [Bacteroidia bacterium]